MTDLQVLVVQERGPNQFALAINHILERGGWRVASTDMSMGDSLYVALLVRSEPYHVCEMTQMQMKKKDGTQE